jgi:hypothetical protein
MRGRLKVSLWGVFIELVDKLKMGLLGESKNYMEDVEEEEDFGFDF